MILYLYVFMVWGRHGDWKEFYEKHKHTHLHKNCFSENLSLVRQIIKVTGSNCKIIKIIKNK